MPEGSKSSTHYLSDTNRFDVSSKGPSSGISVTVVIRYLYTGHVLKFVITLVYAICSIVTNRAAEKNRGTHALSITGA